MNFALCQYVKAILGAWMGDHATVSGAHKVSVAKFPQEHVSKTTLCAEEISSNRIGMDWSNYKPHQASFSAFACVCLRLSGSFSVMRTFRRTKLWPPLQKAFVNAACYLIISYHIISYHIISYHILSYLIISYHISSCPISLLYLIIYQQHSRDILSYHISYCPSPSSAVPCRACANSCITLSSLRSIADMSPLEPSPVRGGPLDPEANAALELLPRRYLSNRNFAQITNRIK
jgi:hypothetical protein